MSTTTRRKPHRSPTPGDSELPSVTELRHLLTGLNQTDVSLLPGQTVRDNLLALVSLTNQLHAAFWAHLAVFDAWELGDLDAFKRTKAWLMAFGRLTPHTAGLEMARATTLRSLPALAAACARGDVCTNEIDEIVDLIKDVGLAAVKESDQNLADLAAGKTAREVRAACNRIRDHLDPDGPEPNPDKDWDKRDLNIARHGNHIIVKGRLDLESGAALITAIDAQLRPPHQDDERTPGQRRADAFAEIMLTVLSHGSLPTVRGRKPTIGLLVRPNALLRPPTAPLTHDEKVAAFLRQYGENLHHTNLNNCTTNQPTDTDTSTAPTDSDSDGGVTGGGSPSTSNRPPDPPIDLSPWDPITTAGFPPQPEGAWMDWVGEIPIQTAQRLACDCTIWRALLDPLTGLPLDVGREQRTAPEWMLRALHTRDKQCRWPGCETPAAWTDAHHWRQWWRDGGETTVEDLVLLCRGHHIAVHEGKWTITMDRNTGEVHIFRPNGRPYELGPTQAWTTPPQRR